MSKTPLKLPFCSFPSASDISLHGMQDLPKNLPLVDMDLANIFRSDSYRVVPINQLSIEEIDDCARLIADSFVAFEPMNKHLIIKNVEPPVFEDTKMKDAFGEDDFGSFTHSNIFYWFVRLFLFTEQKSGSYPILNEDLINNSFVLKDESGEIIGVSLGEKSKISAKEDKNLHPFAQYVSDFKAPILDFLHHQDEEAINGLSEAYPGFRSALDGGKVGGISMIAKNDQLPSEHAFELFAVLIKHFQDNGFEYAITAASNQWTGAAAEVINGVRAHFHPYRLSKIEEGKYTTTSDSYISYKDSGIMFYILKL